MKSPMPVQVHCRVASQQAGALLLQWGLAAVCALLIGAGVAAAQENKAPELADGTIKAQHGDWQVVCKPPPAGAKNEICALVQSVTAEDRPNVGLTVYFQKFSQGVRVLRVFAPFLRCHTFACYAQVTLDDKLISQFTNGKTAIFIIFQTEEAGIGIPLSLNGFGQALAALP
jgi:invasion protein IalB